MIILTLVDRYEEIFETFHLLKSCRSTTRYHSVLDIKKYIILILFCWETIVSFVVVVVVFVEDFVDHFSSSFRRFPLQLSRFLH